MSHSCHQCGAEIPVTAPGAICPACLLERGKSTSITTEEAPAPLLIVDLQAKFPDLEILEFIGSGGMGGVYKARQPQLDRAVALKVIQIGDEPEQHERFLREGKALALLNHPNIVQVYDSGVNDGLGYFVMEYVDGHSLQQILREEPMAPEEAEDFVLQICEALQYAHDQGITHRDIKPANILIAADGQVKIADFGLAKALGSTPSGFQLTLSQQQVGTPYYMAPEQRVPTASADHRADVYALGVVFYEMLTQRLPMGRVDKPSVHCELDPRVDDLVLAAMDTDPDLRPSSAKAMKERLQEIGRSTNRRRTSKDAESTKPQHSRHATLKTLAFTTLLGLALGGLAIWLFPMKATAESALRITNPTLWQSEDDPVSILTGNAILKSTAQALELASHWRLDREAVLERLNQHRKVILGPSPDQIRMQFTDADEELSKSITDQLSKSAVQAEGSAFLGKVTLQINRALHDFKIFHGTPPSLTDIEIKVIRSRNTLYPVIQDLELASTWGLTEPQTFKKLYDALGVREERGTDLITIEYRDEDPSRAAKVANAVAKAYQQRRMDLERERSQNAIDTLQKHIEDQSKKAEEARLRMLDLAERYQIVDTDDLIASKGTIQMTSMHDTFKAKASLAQIKMQLKALEGLEGEELIKTAAKLQLDPTLNTQLAIYHRNKDTRQLMLENGLAEKHPKMQHVTEKIDNSYQSLLDTIESVRQILRTSQDAANQSLGPANDGIEDRMNERRKLAEYSEASKEYELQKNMLQNMEAKFATEKIDLTMPNVSITIREETQPGSHRASLPLEQIAPAAIIGYHGPSPAQLLLGTASIGFFIGLLLHNSIAARLESKRYPLG